MRATICVRLGLAALGAAAIIASATDLRAQQAASAVSIGDSDLGGVVTGPNGPEAGVWVIAETTDLPTKFAKIVVTDDHGRYVMPELPKANYSVWVRGYGLVDSPKVRRRARQDPQPDGRARRRTRRRRRSTIRRSTGIRCSRSRPRASFRVGQSDKLSGEWLNVVKSIGCMSCHALGTIGTRTIPKELGEFKNSAEAWAAAHPVRAGA